MITRHFIVFIIATALVLTACNFDGGGKDAMVKKEYTPVTITPDKITHIIMNDSISHLLLARGRKIAGAAKVALKKELKKAIL